MALRYVAYALVVILVSSVGVSVPAFRAGIEGYNIPPLSVQTDSDSYEQGDTIVVTGLVKKPGEGIPITLRILDSNSKLVQIDQFTPAADGSFSKTYVATGPLWKAAGNYTIIAQYGSAQKADTMFSFSGGTGSTDKNEVKSEVYTIDAGSEGKFNVEYIIKGGTVKNMSIDSESLTLVITIDASKDARTLSIGFAAGDSEIEIVGTQVVPEFGPIAALVLAIAIISIIAVSAKTGLRLMPKY